MPVSSATVSRGWGDLRAEGEGCSQSGKQNSFLSVSVSRSRLVIFRQADKQKMCQSERPALWRISPGHMSSTHGPVRWRWQCWWCWCGLKICPWVSQCLCVSICKWEDGMVRLRKAANMCRPPRGRVISQPGHTEARRRIKEWEMDFTLPRPPVWGWWCVCLCVCMDDGGLTNFQHNLLSCGNFCLAVWNKGLEQNTCVYVCKAFCVHMHVCG